MIARCVIADDHPAMLHAVADFLESSDVDVVATAVDGPSAVAAVEEHAPDAALVDFRMPRLAAVDLLNALHDRAPETRVIVYTAEADEAVVRGALGAGAAGVLLKGSPLPDVVRAIASVVEGATFLDAALAGFAVGVDASKPVLTEREASVLTLLAEGLTHEEIGARLSISAETVRTHVRKACARLGAATRTQAVATAIRMGLIS